MPRRGATKLSESTAYPKKNLLIAGALLLPLLLLLLPGEQATDEAAADVTQPAVAMVEQALPVIIESKAPEPQLEVIPVPEWQDTQVRNGDNLSLIFQRMGLNDGDVYKVVNSSKEAGKLTQIFPGQTMSFLFENGEFLALKHVKSPLESVVYQRDGGHFNVEKLIREPEVQRTFAGAEIKSSLFLAGQEAGLSHSTIMELANIFGGVIDFVLDPRVGDTFNVLYEDLYLDGEKFEDGNILAVAFTNQDKLYTAYRYVDSNNKVGYYNPEGVSMRKAFLRAPLDFTRVSSNFNMRRLHPVLKHTRPHRGTDYAAPTGTPVYAAGDGRVVEAGYTSANGNYVFIQHGQQYTTKYLHLNKRAVKTNQKVTQQQVIGWVGSTGLASGPHLHYEFLVNGVHRNPRTILQKLPQAKSLDKKEMPRFLEHTSPLGTQLASLSQQRLASNNSVSDSATL